MSSYDKTHTEDDCDKCQKRVGKKNLTKVPFVYCDKHDIFHENKSELLRERMIEGQIQFFGYVKNEPQVEDGYRQYQVCPDCWEKYIK